MNEKFISCKCLTYGRVEMLEEALYSFLQQDYPSDKAELIIINDYPLQKLVFDHPQVRIFNIEEPFKTLGDKENFATEQCEGQIVAQYDDDDVCLSNHLQNINKYFVEGTNLMHWGEGVYFNTPDITSIGWTGNSGFVYSKFAWNAIGRYPLENAGYDVSFVKLMNKLGNIVIAKPPKDEVSWFYMWGGRGYHGSGQGKDDETKPNVIVRHQAHIEELRKQGKIPTGIVELQSHWKQDYKTLLQDYIKTNKS